MSTYLHPRRLPFHYAFTGAVALNDILFDWDAQEITTPALALQVASLGAGGQLTPEFSCDEVTWTAGWCEPVGTGVPQAAISSAGLYSIPRLTRFVRLRLSTAITSGTTDFSVTLSYSKSRATALLGQAAHDAAVSGSPVRSAGRAVTANYTAVSTGDTADLITTLVGALIAKPFSIPEADWQYAAAAGGIVNTTDVSARAAQAAGIRNYVTGLQVRNTNAVATEFVVKDGATVIYRCLLPANMTADQVVTFATPLRGTAATAVNVACVTTGAAVYANLQGYSAP